LDVDLEHGLVTSWEVSKDALTWTLHLRQGVKWQNKPPMNGRELVAADAKWTLEKQLKTLTAARRKVLVDTIASIECPDKYTLVIHNKEPQADMLILLANPYIPVIAPELETVTGDLNTPKAVVGVGPFTLDEWVPNVRTVFKKNPDYYRASEGLPYVDTYYTTCIPDPSTSLAAFRAGKIDVRGISRIDLASVKNTNPNIYCYEDEVGLTTLALAMNTEKAPFTDVRVRQAISMALDRKLIIDTFYFGYGIEQNGCIHVGSPWYLKDKGECEKYLKYNIEEAKRLLAEAGYPTGFATTLNCTAGWGSTYMEYVEFVADSLSKIGIKATIKSSDLAAHYANRVCPKYGDGMVFTYNWGAANFAPCDWLEGHYLVGAPNQYSCVDDPKFTDMIHAQRREMDPAKRQEILNEIQRYFACQQYVVQWPLAMGVTCQQPWVRGYKSHAVAYQSGRIAEQNWLTPDAPGRK
jgi:peptide/nickel transport system substrate-binding protein